MPQPVFHLYLAERPAILYAIGDMQPGVRNAFLHGAIAPDVGFFPGGDSQLSVLAHRSRTADMCRSLVELAERPEQRAFAFGWLTHVLADALVHPVINAWCRAELGAHADSAAFMRLHVQLELGIDVMHVAAVRRHGVPRFRSMFTDASVAFLSQAYRNTYGITPSPAALLYGHRNLERLCRRLLDLELVLAGASRDSLAGMPHKMMIHALRAVAAISGGSRSMIAAFLAPVFPNLDLALLLKDRLDYFDRWFSDCLATNLRALPNLDLDTGEPIADEVDPAA